MNIDERAQLQFDLRDACLKAMRELHDEHGLTYGDMIAGLELAKGELMDSMRVKTMRLIEPKEN